MKEMGYANYGVELNDVIDSEEQELVIPQELPLAENYVSNEALNFSRLDEVIRQKLKEQDNGK